MAGLRLLAGLGATSFFGVAAGRRGAGFGFVAPVPFALGRPFAFPMPFALPAVPGAEVAGGDTPGRFEAPGLPGVPAFPCRPRALGDFERPAAAPACGRAVVAVSAGVLLVSRRGVVTAGAGACCSAWFGSVMPMAP